MKAEQAQIQATDQVRHKFMFLLHFFSMGLVWCHCPQQNVNHFQIQNFMHQIFYAFGQNWESLRHNFLILRHNYVKIAAT